MILPVQDVFQTDNVHYDAIQAHTRLVRQFYAYRRTFRWRIANRLKIVLSDREMAFPVIVDIVNAHRREANLVQGVETGLVAFLTWLLSPEIWERIFAIVDGWINRFGGSLVQIPEDREMTDVEIQGILRKAEDNRLEAEIRRLEASTTS